MPNVTARNQILALLAGMTLLGAGPAAAPSPSDAKPVVSLATSAAYERLVRDWSGVTSMSADLCVHTKLRGFPPISVTLNGHTYFQAPDKAATVFEHVPGLLRKMVSQSPSIAPPQAWPDVYDATLPRDENGATTVRLVPKDPTSALEHVDAVIDDTTGLALEYDFTTRSGSMIQTHNRYANVSGFTVLASQHGVMLGRGFAAEVTTSFTNYQFNERLPIDALTR